MKKNNHIQLIDQLKMHLTKNTGEVLQQLNTVFQKNSENRNEVIMLANTYNRLLRDRRMDLIAYTELNREISRINDSLLQLIDFISEEEAQTYEIHNAIFQRILVVCLDEERRAFMGKLLSNKFYKDVDYQLLADIDSNPDINRYQLIIFDAVMKEKEFAEIYNQLLENAKPHLLYFGKARLPDTNAKGEAKAYFATSVFSIHARTQEMIAYLKYSTS